MEITMEFLKSQSYISFRSLEFAGISLQYENSPFVDSYGNRFRFKSKLYREDGSDAGKMIYDVFLQSAPK